MNDNLEKIPPYAIMDIHPMGQLYPCNELWHTIRTLHNSLWSHDLEKSLLINITTHNWPHDSTLQRHRTMKNKEHLELEIRWSWMGRKITWPNCNGTPTIAKGTHSSRTFNLLPKITWWKLRSRSIASSHIQPKDFIHLLHTSLPLPTEVCSSLGKRPSLLTSGKIECFSVDIELKPSSARLTNCTGKQENWWLSCFWDPTFVCAGWMI